jgi:DNA repair protein RecO
MPAVTTDAVVLHVMPYRETSAILRLLTRDLGVVSALARGARRARSRTGNRLDLFTSGAATLFIKPHRDLHPLIAFEADATHGRLGGDVPRFAAASALAELALKCAPPDPQPHAFDAVAAGLSAIENAPAELVETVALVAVWGLVVSFGFSPALDRCVACGAPVDGGVAFSPAQGGALCPAHRRGEHTSSLKESDTAALAALVSGRLPDALDARHAAAHRRLLVGFIRHHLAEHRAMPALAFWDAAAWDVRPAPAAAPRV